MSKSLVAGIVASFQIAILFIVILIMYSALEDSSLADNPSSKIILEEGQQATINAFNWWLIIGTIGSLILIAGIIFGIIYTVIKITENNSYGGF